MEVDFPLEVPTSTPPPVAPSSPFANFFLVFSGRENSFHITTTGRTRKENRLLTAKFIAVQCAACSVQSCQPCTSCKAQPMRCASRGADLVPRSGCAHAISWEKAQNFFHARTKILNKVEFGKGFPAMVRQLTESRAIKASCE